MKNKSWNYLLIITIFSFLLSCSGKDESNTTIAQAETKEKKPSKKTKPKKKKPVVNTKKTKTISNETDVAEEKASTPTDFESTSMISMLASKVNNYAIDNGYSTELCFLVDMSLPSGRNRFFVYDLNKNSVINAGLVSHGSCNQDFLSRAKFSNAANSGCSSAGKYKVGEFYRGKYGKSFRLYGLDNSNSNALNRAVVIHGYDCVPDQEIYPRVLCNSFGCVMVSYRFFDKISKYISRSEKPIVLWVYG